MKLKTKKNSQDNIIIALEERNCRINHLVENSQGLIQQEFHEFQFNDMDELFTLVEDWSKNYSCKGTNCRWVLGRERYQTHPIDAPKVQAKEINDAIKWQIKDLLEMPVSEVLVSHYLPKQPENQNVQLVAVVVSKPMIESLIEITRKVGLNLDSIEVEELTVGQALNSHLGNEQIVGFIDEDRNGLMFNFYSGTELAFSRHKKGKYLPGSASQAFSLEDDQESLENAFLLETQRTLDYVVTQIFRRPVDKLLLRRQSDEDNYLADILKQITEVEVTLISPTIEQTNPEFSRPTLMEAGTALRLDV